eukprot:CAMPEP_0177682670 /NCGR_PEP_ID=MMETSP0447-20121125/31379_1 /TAXON_ID=0 /ORGANISM="Stygamoeba regulata, Strain BSH-02190019" /LENGTH=89 /DNA_ID=CAMNT_0019192181 /DNA_START=143 /DNA_END=408 /DNA_ORIENTATION=+
MAVQPPALVICHRPGRGKRLPPRKAPLAGRGGAVQDHIHGIQPLAELLAAQRAPDEGLIDAAPAGGGVYNHVVAFRAGTRAVERAQLHV